jgi:hypothetical protein
MCQLKFLTGLSYQNERNYTTGKEVKFSLKLTDTCANAK